MKKILGIQVLISSVLFLAASGTLHADWIMGPPVPGSVEGNGTSFQITDSDYKNFSLTSSAAVDLYMLSTSGVIEILLDSRNEPLPVEIIISGLESHENYYLYEDGYENGQIITTDGAGGYARTVDTSEPHRIVIKQNPSTYFLSDRTWVDGAGITHNPGWSDGNGLDITYIDGVQNGIATWDETTRTATLVQDVG